MDILKPEVKSMILLFLLKITSPMETPNQYFLEGVSQASLLIAHTRKKVILLPSQWTVMKAKDRSIEALAKE